MLAALAAAAVLQLGQPGCVQEDFVVSASTTHPFVQRGAVVEFTVGAYNHSAVARSRVEVRLRVESIDRVARLDGLVVEVSEGGSQRRLERSAGTPDHTFTATLAEVDLAARANQVFAVRLHLDPGQPGSVRTFADVTNIGCQATGQFDVLVAKPDVPATSASGWSLPLGIGAGALAVLLALILQALARQPARLARRDRS